MEGFLLESGWDDGQSISGVSLSSSVVGYLASGSKKVSDAVTYGPKFCELFRNFTMECSLEIDINRHLLALILDYLVEFLRWVRKDDHTIAEVGNLLFNNDYLRPETRNGVIMVIIYMFSSIKATVLPDTDMFSVLVNKDFGLGIANKFSLKIYNDPYYYLSFLKLSLSALIDCGMIPENERVNISQKPAVKSTASKIQDSNEYNKFMQLKTMVVSALDSKKIDEAQKIVEVIAVYWQDNKREIVRGKQFSLGLQAIQSSDLTLPLLLNHEGYSNTDDTLPRTNLSVDESMEEEASANGGVTPSLTSSFKRRRVQFASENTVSNVTSSAKIVITKELISYAPIPAILYTRIGLNTWAITEYTIFDLDQLFRRMKEVTPFQHTIYLLDSPPPLPSSSSPILQYNSEYTLQPHTTTSTSTSTSSIFTTPNLRAALLQEKVLVTEWHVDDPQLHCYCSLLANTSSRNLLTVWKNNQEQSDTTSSVHSNEGQQDIRGIVRGYLAVELNLQMIICLRQVQVSPSKPEKREDLWCHFYVHDLLSSGQHDGNTAAITCLGDFILELFPQLRKVYRKDHFATILVKYKPTLLRSYAHNTFPQQNIRNPEDSNNNNNNTNCNSPELFPPPFDVATSEPSMETMGTLMKPLRDTFHKLSSSFSYQQQICYNFVLEFI